MPDAPAKVAIDVAWQLCAGSEACQALSLAVRWLPQDPLPSRRSTCAEEEHAGQAGPEPPSTAPDSAPADSSAPDSNGASLQGSQAHAHLDPIAEQGVMLGNGDVQSLEHALENGNGAPKQGNEQFETLTFHVGGGPLQCHFTIFVQTLLPIAGGCKLPSRGHLRIAIRHENTKALNAAELKVGLGPWMFHICQRDASWHLIMAGKDSYALALVMAGAFRAKGLQTAALNLSDL